MQIIKDRRIVEDHWRRIDMDQPAGTGDIIVPLTRWQAEREALIARTGQVGVLMAPDQPPELIADDLAHLALVAYEFPSFKDGRPYSHARLLRERHGYSGEIRAVGDVLRDQIFYMARCGFTAFEPRADRDIKDALAALGDFSQTYQPAADQPLPLYRRRH